MIKRGLYWLGGLAAISFMLDLLSTYMAIAATGEPLLEGHWLTIFFPSINLITIIHIIAFPLILYAYQKSTEQNAFICSLLIVCLSSAKLLAAWNNFQVYLHPPSPEVIAAYVANPTQKYLSYFIVINSSLIYPVIVGLIAWAIFSSDFKVVPRKGLTVLRTCSHPLLIKIVSSLRGK